MKLLLSALVILAGASAACAAFAHTNEITLQQALRLGLQHNPQLAGYPYRRAVLAGELMNAQLRPETRAHLDAENLAGSGDYPGLDAAELTLSFSSMIELGGQRDARTGVVTARQQQLDSEARAAMLDVAAAINNRFVALLAAQEQMRLEEEAVHLAQGLVQSLEHRVQAGSTPKAELMRARAALARTQIAQEKARQQVHTESLLLSAYWADATPDFTHARGDLFAFADAEQPRAASLAYWRDRLAHNPDLALLADTTRLRDAERRRAESEGKLTLGWNAGVRQLQQTGDTALILGLSIPLAASTRTRGAVQAARAEQEAALFDEDNAKSLLETRLVNTYSAHQNALGEARSLRDHILPLLQEASRATANAFEQGRYSSLELALAQRELLEARAQLINAALRAHETRIELERLTASAPVHHTQPGEIAQ